MISLLSLAVAGLVSGNPYYAEFQNFVSKYNKKYSNVEEYDLRFKNFIETVHRVEAQNEEHVRLGGEEIFGINEFADLTPAEFKKYYLMKDLPFREPNPVANAPSTEALPSDIDWRNYGAVTAVKNQGQCGSCWAHSADEAAESFDYLQNGNKTLQVLSVQQCTACTYSYNGCNGGWPHDAYVNAIHNRNGIESDATYPYNINQAGQCAFTGNAPAPVANDYGSTPYVSPAKGTLQTILGTVGPPSVCVAAESWQSYTGGVMKTCVGQVDHCVQAVGYQTTGVSESYWIVRNSWGTSWGVAGYIYLDMTAQGGDICQIQNYMTYPLMSATAT